jgi:hypothetical protein
VASDRAGDDGQDQESAKDFHAKLLRISC